MKNMIYTMGFVEDNGDIVISGSYRDEENENLVCITISKDKISAEVFKTAVDAPVLSPDIIRRICKDGA